MRHERVQNDIDNNMMVGPTFIKSHTLSISALSLLRLFGYTSFGHICYSYL